VAAERRLYAASCVLFVAACSAGASNAPAGKPAAKSRPEDPVRAALMTLHYDASPPPVDPSNRFDDDDQAALLGQKLFFERALSGPLLEGDNDGTGGTLGLRGEPGRVACADCHVPATGFVDTRSPHRQISLAAQWSKRRAPTLLESANLTLYSWDGRRDSIWGQSMGVMESDHEFNSSRLFIAEEIFRSRRADYEALFGAMPPLDDATRFPPLAPDQAGCREVQTRSGSTYPCRGKPGDGADYDGMAPGDQHDVTLVMVNVAKAISAYVRRLRCGPSRFDAWLDGDEASLSAGEQRGAALFVGKGQCVRCHSGSELSDGKFHDVGLAPASVAVAFTDSGDDGAADGIQALLADPLNTKGEFSDGDRGVLPDGAGPELVGAFRTPTLRCIAKQPSFMHTAQMKTLDAVVAFHARGGDSPGSYPGVNELSPLELTSDEQADLVAFLQALDGPGADPALQSAP
jgi:cytochrome c peroxidase